MKITTTLSMLAAAGRRFRALSEPTASSLASASWAAAACCAADCECKGIFCSICETPPRQT